MAFRALVLAVLASFVASAKVPIQKVPLIAEGVIEGFLSDQPDLEACTLGLIVTVDDVEEAVHDIEQMDTADVLKGLSMLGKAMEGLPGAFEKCNATAADVTRIVLALAQFKSPISFAAHVGKNLIVNGHDIYKEIEAAIADWKAQDYKGFGVQVGTALRKLVLSDEEKFGEFLALHQRSYTTSEEWASKFATFAKNLAHMASHQRAEREDAVYSHLSPFADISPEEFSRTHKGLRFQPSDLLASTGEQSFTVADQPVSFDWRAKGAVNDIKDQGDCGSCWAFATVANIEGVGFALSGKLESLSEQELVDCDKDKDQGCNGGLPSNAYTNLIKHSTGLETESDYPYQGVNRKCRAKKDKEIAFIGNWTRIGQNEDMIAAALMQYGPLAIGINAAFMQFYTFGIASYPTWLCDAGTLDHGVAIVGFGYGGIIFKKNYWIIRNSWGRSWGEKGYYRIVRGYGMCGLNNMVTTVTEVNISSPSEDTTIVV